MVRRTSEPSAARDGKHGEFFDFYLGGFLVLRLGQRIGDLYAENMKFCENTVTWSRHFVFCLLQ